MSTLEPSNWRSGEIKKPHSLPKMPNETGKHRISESAQEKLKAKEPPESSNNIDGKVSTELKENLAVTSEKVKEATGVKSKDKSSTPSSKALKKFLSENNEKFIAHAIKSPQAIKKVLDKGELKPAEEVLFEGENLEYEAGTTGARGTAKLPDLSDSEINSLIDAFLSPEERQKLDSLQKRLDDGDDFVTRGKEIKEKINTNTDDENDEIFDWVENEDYKDYKKYNELRKKGRGVTAKFKDDWGFYSKSLLTNFKLRDEVKRIAEEHGCPEIAVKMALLKKHYPSIPGNKGDIDKYIAKKVDKIRTNERMSKDEKEEAIKEVRGARSFLFSKNTASSGKLNAEIRFASNKVFWRYGDVVIIKGTGNEEDRKRFIDQDIISEVLTPDPVSNKGEYFKVDLKNEDNLIILGPRKQLEGYKDSYGERLIYIEDLTEEQQDKLKIPDEMRPKS